MENYALSQILLGAFIPKSYFHLGGGISMYYKSNAIIILKGRRSLSGKIEAQLIEQIIKEKDRGIVIVQESPQDCDFSYETLQRILKEIKNAPIIHPDKELEESRVLMEAYIDDLKNPLYDIQLLNNIDKDRHKFISKDSGGHVAKPGTKQYRAFKNEFNKNSYKKKKRK